MRTLPSVTCNWKKKHFFNEEHQKKSQSCVTSNRFKREKFLSVCGLNLKFSSYRSPLSRKAELPDGFTLTATSDTSCTSAELGKDWITQGNQRNQLQQDILQVSSYHSPDLQVFMFTDGGFSPSLPGISCIPSVDATWQSIPLPHLSWKTPASSVSNCTPNTPLFLPTPSFLF